MAASIAISSSVFEDRPIVPKYDNSILQAAKDTYAFASFLSKNAAAKEAAKAKRMAFSEQESEKALKVEPKVIPKMEVEEIPDGEPESQTVSVQLWLPNDKKWVDVYQEMSTLGLLYSRTTITPPKKTFLEK